MAGVDSVELVEKWVQKDLSRSIFTDEEKRRVLDDIDKIEEDLTLWDRDLLKCVSIVKEIDSVTVYRSKPGDLRSYFIREGTTLYCIGVGKRRTTYDRDLGTMEERAIDYNE